MDKTDSFAYVVGFTCAVPAFLPLSSFIDIDLNCGPSCGKSPLSSGGFRNSPRAMPLFVAPHRPIAFGSHKSLRKRIRSYVLTGLLLFGNPNNLKFTQPAKVLIHSCLANKAKARLPNFSHNLHLDIYSISLTFSNMYQIPTCRLFENARSYPSQITHQPPLLAIAREERRVFIY